MRKQLFIFLGQTLWVSCIALVIYIACFLLVARSLSPLVAQQRALIERGVSALIAKPVSIGAVGIAWDGLPELQATQVLVQDETGTHTLLTADEVDVELGVNVIEALFNKKLKLNVEWQNLSFVRWGKIPGINGLSGTLYLTANNGSLHLSDKKGSIDFGPLFRAAIPLDQLTANIKWRRKDNDWLIKVSNFSVANGDGTATGDMVLSVPYDGSSPTINLHAAMEMNNATHLGNYLPLTVLHPPLVEWLTNSIVAIKNAQAHLSLQGRLEDFPFDNNNGLFRIDSKIIGGEVHYWPGWPALHDMNGELTFVGRRMDVNINSARTLNTSLQDIHAFIPILKKDVIAVLNVDGDITGDLADGLEFLHQSPLRGGVFATLQNFQAKGPMQLQLHLAIPVEKTSMLVAVAGKLILQNNILTTPQWHLELSNIKGPVDFTRAGINAPALTASLWKQPVKLAINTQTTTQIRLQYGAITANLLPQANGGWSLALQSPTMLGQVLIPNPTVRQPLQANFQKLYLSADSLQSNQNWSPKDLPSLNFSCTDFRYGDKQFGQVQLQLLSVSNGLKITTLQAKSSAFNLTANGSWFSGRGGDSTQLTGALTSANIGAALSNWGMPATGITAQQSKVQFNLAWAGAAYDPSFTSMSGQFNLNLKQGVLSDLSTSTAVKIGIGRMLNLLSVDSLIRDLKLNFNDFKTTTGFAFDSLQGDFVLNNGNALTRNTLIKGTVANVGITGRIGLAAKDYDLQVAVTPHVTASLPVLAGFAGGPVVGVATWAASKVLSIVVDGMTTSTYRMTGAWANPTIVKVNMAKQ